MNLHPRHGNRPATFVAMLGAVSPGIAGAHGFGQRYDLPLPLTLYLCGAALTVTLSCVMLLVFVRAPRDTARFDLLAHPATRWLAAPAMVAGLRLLAVALYLLLLVAGFIGNQSPFRNVVPITVWALWWVGLAYFSVVAGDLWRVANPLETLFAAADRAYARMRPGKHLSLERPAPAWLQSWPALVLYVVFLWMETAWDGADVPARIAAAILLYSILTWSGMAVYGRDAWLAHGEVFTRVFGLLARFSPTEITLRDRRIAALALRPYAVGLLTHTPADRSEIALVVTILAAVSFDGFLETPAWASVNEALAPDGDGAVALRTAALVEIGRAHV